MRPVATSAIGGTRLRIPFSLPACLVFCALAALILNPLFGARAAFVFLSFGGLLLVSQPAYSINALLKYRLLLILPAFCALSVLWSQFPGQTLRYSIQLGITFCIAIAIATRVAPATLLRCLYAIYSIGIYGSILFGRVRDDNGAWVGIFGSKNAFAAIVTGFALTSLALMLDRNAARPLRLLAFATGALSLPLFLVAQSTGSIVFMVPAAVAVVGVMIARHLSWAQKLLIGLLVVLLTTAGLIMLVYFGDELLSTFLDYSGKDATLTGRTDLWASAFDLIAERPLLGLGYQAFWVHGFGPAEELWAMFGIESRSGFNFHNTYISNAVEIGIVGVALQVAVIYGTFIGIMRWALAVPSAESAYLVGFLTLLIGTTFIEVGVFFQFSIATIIVVCASVYAMRYQEWRRAQAVHSSQEPAQ